MLEEKITAIINQVLDYDKTFIENVNFDNPSYFADWSYSVTGKYFYRTVYLRSEFGPIPTPISRTIKGKSGTNRFTDRYVLTLMESTEHVPMLQISVGAKCPKNKLAKILQEYRNKLVDAFLKGLEEALLECTQVAHLQSSRTSFYANNIPGTPARVSDPIMDRLFEHVSVLKEKLEEMRKPSSECDTPEVFRFESLLAFLDSCTSYEKWETALNTMQEANGVSFGQLIPTFEPLYRYLRRHTTVNEYEHLDPFWKLNLKGVCGLDSYLHMDDTSGTTWAISYKIWATENHSLAVRACFCDVENHYGSTSCMHLTEFARMALPHVVWTDLGSGKEKAVLTVYPMVYDTKFWSKTFIQNEMKVFSIHFPNYEFFLDFIPVGAFLLPQLVLIRDKAK